jgi:Zinc knuckle
LHLLSSLPSSYQSLSRVLLHRDRKTITYNEVVSALLTDDLQQKLMMPSQPSFSSGTALNVTRGRPRWRTNDKDGKRSGSNWRSKSRGKSQDKKTIVCWKCGKSGHIKKDCRVSSKAIDPPSVSVAREEDEDDLLDDDIAL